MLKGGRGAERRRGEGGLHKRLPKPVLPAGQTVGAPRLVIQKTVGTLLVVYRSSKASSEMEKEKRRGGGTPTLVLKMGVPWEKPPFRF